MNNQKTNTVQPKIGHEYITADEDVIIQEMVSEMQEQMNRLYADKFMPRQIHTKMHGCVKGRFTVEPNLSEKLKVGIFSSEKSYHCYVRFSNSQTTPKPDKKKDIRGIAIKLLGVSGEKVLNNKRDTEVQDFLLMSSETFFSKNITEFRKTLKASTAKSKSKLLFYFLNPKHWSLLKRLMKTMIKCDNPLNIPYWSTQASRYGNGYEAVKYYLKPSKETTIVNESLDDDDYLRFNLSQTLYSHSAKFDFYVQFQTDANTMPIEDPTIPWDSEFLKVATLEIPAQKFDSEAQWLYGQNLAFNSWHSLTQHRPLGNFNRARKRVYEVMSDFRHQHNNLKNEQPIDSADFLEGTQWPKENVIPHQIPTKKVIKIKSQVLINCSRKTAFKFISSGEELPNWLKKSGKIDSALNAEILTGTYDHIGAKRIVYFDGGDSTLEELLSYNPYANYSYKISEFTNSMKKFTDHAYSQIWFDRVNDKTRVTWDYSFTAKNAFSRLILKLILPKMFKKFMAQSLHNAKLYIENGD